MSNSSLRLGAALLVSSLLAACEPPPAPETEEVDSLITSGGVYVIKGVGSGKCIDVTGNVTTSGALIEQWDCNGQKNQQFKFRDVGGGLYEVTPQNSPDTQCLDVYQSSLADGGKIDQWSCNGHTSQRWKLVQPTAGSGKFELVAQNSGKCLDVTGASTARGAKLQQWTCKGATNQLFTLTAVGGGGGTGGTSGTGGSTGSGGTSGTGGTSGGGGSDGCTLRWSPSASEGKGAFEGLEMPDSNGVHPGATHFSVAQDAFRIDQHYNPPGAIDYDGKVQDRLRCEVKGTRANGTNLQMLNGQTWRLRWSLYVPASLKGSTRFHHIWQLKHIDTAGSSSYGPVLTISLINQSGVEKIKLDVFGVTSTTPVKLIHDRWLTTEVTFKIAPGTGGNVRWKLWDGATLLADETKSGISTWPANAARLRPKWGIYRSLGDLNAIQTTYILLSNMKGYTCP
jgi:hypothetical protein